jgi:hypothetical protein
VHTERTRYLRGIIRLALNRVVTRISGMAGVAAPACVKRDHATWPFGVKSEIVPQRVKIAFGPRQAGQTEQRRSPSTMPWASIFNCKFQSVAGKNRSVVDTGRGVSHWL